MADSRGLAGALQLTIAIFARIPGLFGNGLGTGAARLGGQATPSLPFPAFAGTVGGALDFNSARSYRTAADARRLRTGGTGA